MLIFSLIAHIALGLFLGLFFVLYYVNGQGRAKMFIEFLIGIGGNTGAIFLLDNMIPIDDNVIRWCSISGCILSFIIATILTLIIFSKIIEKSDDDVKAVIKMKDIFLGQYSYINRYYKSKNKEIDEMLGIDGLQKKEEELKKRETEIEKKELILQQDRQYLNEELLKLETKGAKATKIILPENKKIALTGEYIEIIPSYIRDIFNCISAINSGTEEFLKSEEALNKEAIQSYLLHIATCISTKLFGGNSNDVRVHFRVYDEQKNGYVKFVAVLGNSIFTKEMTVMPYDGDTMIKKSYENKRALIKSINSPHNYQSKNYRIWKDYITYTFNDLTYENKPYLSFGISVKNAERYKKWLYLINYFEFERYLQENLERVNNYVDIADIIYGGKTDVWNK